MVPNDRKYIFCSLFSPLTYGKFGRRPHKRGAEVVEEIEHALTKWSRYGVDMPRAARLELCKVRDVILNWYLMCAQT